MSDQVISGGAGMPDSWQRLWAPHRMSYLEGENRPLPEMKYLVHFVESLI